MKKYEFVREFASQAGITQKKAREFLDIISDIVVDHIKDDDGISPFDGVRFKAVYRNGRNARNPHTGETFVTEPKYAPRAKFSKIFKDSINV